MKPVTTITCRVAYGAGVAPLLLSLYGCARERMYAANDRSSNQELCWWRHREPNVYVCFWPKADISLCHDEGRGRRDSDYRHGAVEHDIRESG